MKKCPYCTEEIQDEAIKCRFCGEMLGTPPPPSRPEPQPRKVIGPLDENDGIEWMGSRLPPDLPHTPFRSLVIGLVIVVGAVLVFGFPIWKDMWQFHFGESPEGDTAVASLPVPPAPVPQKAIFAIGVANIRSGPSADSSIVRKAMENEGMVYSNQNGDWYKIQGVENQWIHKSVVRTEEEKRSAAALEALYKLEIVSWKWGTEHGYAKAEGLVKNITDESMSGIEAVVTYKTKGGDFITSDSSFIDINPILPGQTSPFSVLTKENPAMDTASLQFKRFGGGKILARKKK